MDEAVTILSYALRQQWDYCTVYTIGIKHIKDKVRQMYKDFKTHIGTRDNRRNDAWKQKMVKYNVEMSKLCDIYCRNDQARKAHKEEVGVEMSET